MLKKEEVNKMLSDNIEEVIKFLKPLIDNYAKMKTANFVMSNSIKETLKLLKENKVSEAIEYIEKGFIEDEVESPK